jgi:hypothetical protein
MTFPMTHSPRSSIGCVLDDFHAYGTFGTNRAPILCHHLAVLSGASKTISEPMVRSVQTMHLYCIDTNAVSKRTKMLETETRFHMTHSPRRCVQHDFWADGRFDTNRAPFFRQNYHYVQTDSNVLPLKRHHLGVSSVASKTNYEPIVCLAKPCTYIALTLRLSPNGPKQDSTCPSPRNSIGCVQDDFLSPWYVWHKLRTYLASRLALSPNGLKQASTWASSPRSIVGCV